MKRVFIFHIALLLTMGLYAYNFKYGDLYYNITSDSTVKVTYENQRSNDNYPGLSSISIPDVVIGDDGITYRVTSIGNEAFYNCIGLTSITIPNSVTSIGSSAFFHCTGLTSIAIPNSVTSIGSEAFYYCSSLTSITIPDGVTSIGKGAFDKTPWYNNQSDGIVYIGKVLYEYKGTMPYNTSINIPDGIVSITASAFAGYTNLTSITIPNSVTTIGSWAFSNCTGLTSITIPDGVTSIGEGAFDETPWYNNQSDGIVYIGKVLYKYKGTIPYNTSINIPDGIVSITASAFASYTNLTSITIPNSVTTIGSWAFSDCTGLTSITIPDGVKDIECYAFRNCTGLTDVTIGDGVTTIGDNEVHYYEPHGAFANCTNLTSITIGKGVKSIGTTTFSGCDSLKSVYYRGTLADWVDIDFGGYNVLYGYLVDKSNGANPLEYADSLWIDNKYITEVTIPDGVTEIKRCAFWKYKGLQQIHFPNTLKTIGDGAFYSTRIKNLNIPHNITSLGTQIFYGCTGIDTLIIGNGVYSIDDQFDGCGGITYLQLGSGVKSIDYGAFYDSKKLKRIVCYAVEPPASRKGSFYNYNIHVQVPCDNLEDYETDAVWGSFKYLECVGADNVDTDGKVIITPSDNEVEITWPSDGSADTYNLVITQDGKEVCTLIFNSNGQLMRIAFAAPSRNGATRHAPVAMLTQSGYRFTVTGLNSGTQYAYAIDVKDKAGTSLNTYKGTFTTTVDGKSTDVKDVTTDTSLESDAPRKVFRDGQVYILRGGKTYTLTGVGVNL